LSYAESTEFHSHFRQHSYTAYNQQESTSQMQCNDQYFPSFQNKSRELRTDVYDYADMWSHIFRINRDKEFPLEKVGRHADQQNVYSETSTIQNR
jgi:hypothetical protein